MNFEDLTPEQQEKARACKTAEELVELAKSEGCKLSDDELDGISGGEWFCSDNMCSNVCPDYDPCRTLH